MKISAEIREALHQLGYSMDGAEPTIKRIAQDRYRVDLNGWYVGIWDHVKQTFVD